MTLLPLGVVVAVMMLGREGGGVDMKINKIKTQISDDTK
jgi:hypothetical protein